MRAQVLWPLLLAISLVSCVLSPGHDLPSAGNDNTGEEGPLPPIAGGDGDITVGGDGDASPIFPPEDVSCAAGGGVGGMGGACDDTTAHR